MKRIAIVGGGISGMTAAYECTRHNQTICTLFEASDRLGGTVRTRKIALPDGREYTVELGPDGWVSEKPWASDLAKELGLRDELVPSNDVQRRTLLLRNGELQPFPEGMRMMVPLNDAAIRDSSLLSDAAKLCYLQEPSRAEELRALAQTTQDISVADFVRRHYGEEATRTLAGPLLAGVFGGDIERLSAKSVMPAFVAMEREYGSLTLALRARQPNTNAASGIFTALRVGNLALIEAMNNALPEGCVRTNTPVFALERDGSRWRVTTAAGSDLFDSVILATPAHVTARLLAPVDPRLAELHDMPASSGVMVALLYQEVVTLPAGFGFLVEQPQPGFHPALLAATFSHQKYPHSVPAGCMMLRVFFGCENVSAVESLDDPAIGALAIQQIQKLLPSLPKPFQSLVQRWPRSLPQYWLGHEAAVAEIEHLCQGHPGLYLAGNSYRGVGLPDMVHLAREHARRAVQG